jgi:hypothetical protein
LGRGPPSGRAGRAGRASGRARGRLERAIKHIDGAFGEGYARKNPNLVTAFITASGADFNVSVLCKTLQI